MKPTESPRRKRPWVSSRAASVTPPVRTCCSVSSIAAALRRASAVGSSATAAARPEAIERVGDDPDGLLGELRGALGGHADVRASSGRTTTSSAGTSWMPASSS